MAYSGARHKPVMEECRSNQMNLVWTSETDEPRPSATDEPRPSATDEPRPSATDESRPSATEAVPDVSRQPSICPDPEDLPRAPELSAAARRPECGSTPVIKTRSGRVVIKPARYAASGK